VPTTFPPPRSQIGIALAVGIGAASHYAVQHLPADWPPWLGTSVGAILMGVIAVTFLYRPRPMPKVPPNPPPPQIP